MFFAFVTIAVMLGGCGGGNGDTTTTTTGGNDYVCQIDTKLINSYSGSVVLDWSQEFYYNATYKIGCENCCSGIMSTTTYTEFCPRGNSGSPGAVYKYCTQNCPMSPMMPPGLASACGGGASMPCANSGSTSNTQSVCKIDAALVNYNTIVANSCTTVLHWQQTVAFDESSALGCRNCCGAIAATNDYTEFCEHGNGNSVGTVYQYCKTNCPDIPMQPPGLSVPCNGGRRLNSTRHLRER